MHRPRRCFDPTCSSLLQIKATSCGDEMGNGVGNGAEKVGNGLGHRLARRERGPAKDDSTRALEELRLTTIRGNIDGVRNALQKGVSVNQTLQGGWSPLMYACSMGHPDLVQLLLQEGANPNFHKELFTPLMAACASTRENEERLLVCVDLLLAHGADANAVERHRLSPLMFAAKEGHDKLVRRLARRHGANLNLQDSQGWTALFWAVNQGRTLVVASLVQAGAKVHIKDRRGQTAFDLAASKGLGEVASVLSTQHLSREPPDSSLDYADPALSVSLASLPPSELSDHRHDGFDAELEILLNGMALSRHALLSPPVLTPCSRSAFPFCPSPLSRSTSPPFPPRSPSPFADRDALDEPLSRNARRVIRAVRRHRQLRNNKRSNAPPTELTVCPRNETYSLHDALVVLSSTVRHLSVLFASVSYVRLRLQGRPVDLPLDRRYSGTHGLAALSARALRQADLLCSEVRFLHQFTNKLNETDEIVPADVIVEKKDGLPTYTISSVLVAATVSAVLVFKWRLGPPALVWWWG